MSRLSLAPERRMCALALSGSRERKRECVCSRCYVFDASYTVSMPDVRSDESQLAPSRRRHVTQLMAGRPACHTHAARCESDVYSARHSCQSNGASAPAPWCARMLPKLRRRMTSQSCWPYGCAPHDHMCARRARRNLRRKPCAPTMAANAWQKSSRACSVFVVVSAATSGLCRLVGAPGPNFTAKY